MESFKYIENYFECDDKKYCLNCVINYLNPLELVVIKINKSYEIYDFESNISKKELNCEVCGNSLISYINAQNQLYIKEKSKQVLIMLKAILNVKK